MQATSTPIASVTVTELGARFDRSETDVTPVKRVAERRRKLAIQPNVSGPMSFQRRQSEQTEQAVKQHTVDQYDELLRNLATVMHNTPASMMNEESIRKLEQHIYGCPTGQCEQFVDPGGRE